ncbi:MAG: DUF2520 domain-containing protein [Bacteroidales bacterium]|jgi:predicted short-subunit dehydrogenase-like oxidoreductase (DUF2520 family)
MYRISFCGSGNVAYRLSMAIKAAGFSVPYICGRNTESSEKLVHILNKSDNNPHHISEITKYTKEYQMLADSDIVILAVSDDAIEELADNFVNALTGSLKKPILLHTSGASSMNLLSGNDSYGVIYPLMTLSKIKPVDFRQVPFFIEFSNDEVKKVLTEIIFSLGAEYKIADSQERLKIHLAAVYVSNFVNYLTGLAFDLAKPNHMFLMPLAIETVRKAFLYEHPSIVQTGPAKRGDMKTIDKHLSLLSDMTEHKELYEIISKLIAEQKSKK